MSDLQVEIQVAVPLWPQVLCSGIVKYRCQVSANRSIAGRLLTTLPRVLNLYSVISISFGPLKKKLQQTPICSKLSLPGYRLLHSSLLHGVTGLDATVRKMLLCQWLSRGGLICSTYYPLSRIHWHQNIFLSVRVLISLFLKLLSFSWKLKTMRRDHLICTAIICSGKYGIPGDLCKKVLK
jgi:hypothetical protein